LFTGSYMGNVIRMLLNVKTKIRTYNLPYSDIGLVNMKSGLFFVKQKTAYELS